MYFGYNRLWNATDVWLRSNKKDKKKDQNYKIKIIVISATVKDDIIRENSKFLNLKIDKFLEKPITLDNLKKEIEKLILYTN